MPQVQLTVLTGVENKADGSTPAAITALKFIPKCLQLKSHKAVHELQTTSSTLPHHTQELPHSETLLQLFMVSLPFSLYYSEKNPVSTANHHSTEK